VEAGGQRPEGPGSATASPWATVPTSHTVLLVVQNLTTLGRTLDVAAALAGDRRIQFLVTSDLTDPFADRLPEQVTACGLPAVPWEQAVSLRPDLIISSGHHGAVAQLTGPAVLLSHGIGFSKLAPGAGGPDGDHAVYGLDPGWLLTGGRPWAAALGFPHPAQIELLADQAGPAAGSAVLVGDPTYDRILASASLRQAYREAAGTGSRTAIVVSSTWSPTSLLGRRPELVGQLTAELDPRQFQVFLIPHPNVWAWHGEYQLRSWFADQLRAGLVLVPPERGWQAALVAADVVLGDHGSVTVYAAALGRPTLLATFPDGEVVPGSAAHRLGSLAERLPAHAPVLPVLDAALTTPAQRYAPVRDLVTSAPGQSLRLLRDLFLRLLRLDPVGPAPDPRPHPVTDLAVPLGPGVRAEVTAPR
jgi:hypothetical protein